MWQSIKDFFSETDFGPMAVEYGVKLLGLIATIVIGMIVARVARRVVVKVLGKAKIDKLLVAFFGNAARYFILILVAIFCLGMFGIETASLAAVLAAAGFAVGLAFQGSLSNFSAGVMLLIFRPFKIGDVVNTAGVVGKVAALDLFTTELTTPDNRKIIVPNSGIFGSNIENVTHHPTRRVSVPVGVDYNADLDQCRKILERVASEVPGVLQDPAPQVFLSSLGASSVDWDIRLWVKTPDFFAVQEEATRVVKRLLDEASIGIPYPQMDVHLDPALVTAMKA